MSFKIPYRYTPTLPKEKAFLAWCEKTKKNAPSIDHFLQSLLAKDKDPKNGILWNSNTFGILLTAFSKHEDKLFNKINELSFMNGIGISKNNERDLLLTFFKDFYTQNLFKLTKSDLINLFLNNFSKENEVVQLTKNDLLNEIEKPLFKEEDVLKNIFANGFISLYGFIKDFPAYREEFSKLFQTNSDLYQYVVHSDMDLRHFSRLLPELTDKLMDNVLNDAEKFNKIIKYDRELIRLLDFFSTRKHVDKIFALVFKEENIRLYKSLMSVEIADRIIENFPEYKEQSVRNLFLKKEDLQTFDGKVKEEFEELSRWIKKENSGGGHEFPLELISSQETQFQKFIQYVLAPQKRLRALNDREHLSEFLEESYQDPNKNNNSSILDTHKNDPRNHLVRHSSNTNLLFNYKERIKAEQLLPSAKKDSKLTDPELTDNKGSVFSISNS